MPEATERFLSDGLGLVGLVRADGLRGQAWGDEAGRQGALQHAHVIGQQGLGESRRGYASPKPEDASLGRTGPEHAGTGQMKDPDLAIGAKCQSEVMPRGASHLLLL